MTVGSTPTAEKVQVQPKKGSTSNGWSRAPVTGSLAATSRRRGRKSAAQRKRDAEKYAAKRMRRKFLPVMHLVDKFIREQQQQQPLDMDEGEPPQFGEPPAGTSGTSRAMHRWRITSHYNLPATRKRSTCLQQQQWLAASTPFRARVVPLDETQGSSQKEERKLLGARPSQADKKSAAVPAPPDGAI